MAKAVVVLAVLTFLQSPAFPQNAQSPVMVSASTTSLPVGQAVLDQPDDAQDSGSLGVLPATFSGDFPCADCEEIRYQLNLFPDHFFLSRMVYQGRSSTFDDLGTWEVTQDGKTVHLSGRGGSTDKFAIREGGTLRQLDAEGHEIASKLNYDLHRIDNFSPINPGLELRGMYRHFADTGRFQECSTGKVWLVATEKDNAALEAAYLQARHTPDQELLVSVKGQVAPRPRMEGEGTQTVLIVEQFLKVSAEGTCHDHPTSASLEGATWSLTHIGDQTVVHKAGVEGPYILLQADGRRISGFAGCNRIIGGYELDGNSIDFTGVATTRMFCMDGMDTESAFTAALRKVKTWKISGQNLDLFDVGGKRVVQFEARASE
jgi:copper homeostasis protein (lipoprotein)